jgi:signal transduction histidine kinase/CheY-like chemotaxis protein
MGYAIEALTLLVACASVVVVCRRRYLAQLSRVAAEARTVTAEAAARDAAARETLELLLAASRICTRGLTHEGMLRELLTLIQRRVACEAISISIRDRDEVSRVAVWPPGALPVGPATRRGCSDSDVVGEALSTGKPVARTSLALPGGLRSGVAVPLFAADEPFGVLAIGSYVRGDAHDAPALVFLEALAAHIAGAVWASELNARLATRARQLEEANRARADFTAAMSHQLRTPLNAILGFTDVLERSPGRDPRERRYLGNIGQAGRTLLELINQVLEHAQLETGRVRVRLQRVMVAALVDDVTAEIRARAARSNVEVQVSVAADATEVITDPHRARQALAHVLANALQVTPPGGRVDVVATAERNGERVRVTVSDTGPGVSAEVRAHLFEPFGVVSQTHAGVGLGLSLARQLLELMDGQIGLDGGPGPGARFWISLPSPMFASVRPIGHGPIVLVVDADEASVELAGLAARELGCQVVGTASGEAALTLVRELRPAAIVLELDLPGCDGLELLATLSSAAETVRIPIVVVSARDDQAASIEAGASAHLVKPQSPASLRMALGNVLDLTI